MGCLEVQHGVVVDVFDVNSFRKPWAVMMDPPNVRETFSDVVSTV